MNFLSSAFSLISTSSIPYTLKEKVVDSASASYPDNRSVWNVYNGINPKNDSPVSVFEFDLKSPAGANNAKLAMNSFKKSKVIKFPGFLNVVDFIENDSYLYIVTERVTPLAHYLREHGKRISKDAKIYGIHSVAGALAFVNTKANCLHGKIDLSSVFVNAHGEWKLFGFELLTNLSSDPDQPIYRLSGFVPEFNENQPSEVAEGGAEAVRKAPFKYDAYKLGVFIAVVFLMDDFSAPYLFKRQALSSAKFPRSLASAVSKLIAAQNTRATVEQFLQETEDFFGENRLVKFAHLLEGIKFEDQAAKLAFFKADITEYIEGELPPGFLDYKVLPEIIQQYNIVAGQKPTVHSTPEENASRQEATSVLLNHILKLSSGLPDDKFGKSIKPVIFSAFALSDRAIRLMLLKYLPEFRSRLTESEIQTKVFTNLLTGLQDTNFLIRETTLTSITAIIDKVSVKQVNQDLLKILAKSQMDPKPSIRTNTLILIINISGKIYATSRNSVVITALAKSLRDSFTPCKLAALSGFEKLIETFSLEEICAKILGHLAVALMDPRSFKVRQDSKRIFDLYLQSVEKHAASLPKNEEDEDAEEKQFYESTGPAETAKPLIPEPKSSLSIGWNVVNRLVSSEPANVGGTLDKSINTSTPDVTRISSPSAAETVQGGDWDEGSDVEDGWDDDFAGASPLDPTPAPFPTLAVKPKARTVAKPSATKATAAKSSPAKSSPAKSSLSLGSTKKTPGSTLKLDLDMDAEEDSWGGDW